MTPGYRQPLQRIDELSEAPLDTPEARELEEWVTLVEVYEDIHYPIS
jgi:hypothetical protein